MTSTSNDDRSVVDWTWDDNNVTRMKGWMVHDCSLSTALRSLQPPRRSPQKAKRLRTSPHVKTFSAVPKKETRYVAEH